MISPRQLAAQVLHAIPKRAFQIAAIALADVVYAHQCLRSHELTRSMTMGKPTRWTTNPNTKSTMATMPAMQTAPTFITGLFVARLRAALRSGLTGLIRASVESGGVCGVRVDDRRQEEPDLCQRGQRHGAHSVYSMPMGTSSKPNPMPSRISKPVGTPAATIPSVSGTRKDVWATNPDRLALARRRRSICERSEFPARN